MSRTTLFFLTRMLVCVLAFELVLAPMRVAYAAGQLVRTLDSGAQLAVPELQWVVLNRAQRRLGGNTWTMEFPSGDRRVLDADRAAMTLGLSAAATAHKSAGYVSSAPVVFVNHSMGDNSARVDIFKTVKLADGSIELLTAQFTPAHGAAWSAAGATQRAGRLTATQTAFDPNPLERFATTDLTKDPNLFYNLSVTASQVVAGMAMRRVGAPIGYMHVVYPEIQQRQEKSGGLLRKKVKTIIEGFSRPEWYILTPTRMQPYGSDAVICAVEPPPGGSCPAEGPVIQAMVNAERWEGALPETLTLVYSWDQTNSSWTVLAFGLLAFAGGLAIAYSGLGSVFAGNAGAISSISTGVGSAVTNAVLVDLSLSAVGAAVADGVGYIAANMLISGSGLTAPQRHYWGSVGSGRLNSAGPLDEHSRTTIERLSAEVAKRIDQSFEHSAAIGTTGGCAANQDPGTCAATGVLPRTDALHDPRWAELTRDHGSPVRNGARWGP